MGKRKTTKKNERARKEAVPRAAEAVEVPEAAGVPCTDARALTLLSAMAELAENLRERERDIAGVIPWLATEPDGLMCIESGEEAPLSDPRVRWALSSAVASLLGFVDRWTEAVAATRAASKEGR